MDMEVILVFKNGENDVIKTWWKKINSGRGRRLNNARDSILDRGRRGNVSARRLLDVFFVLRK